MVISLAYIRPICQQHLKGCHKDMAVGPRPYLIENVENISIGWTFITNNCQHNKGCLDLIRYSLSILK